MRNSIFHRNVIRFSTFVLYVFTELSVVERTLQASIFVGIVQFPHEVGFPVGTNCSEVTIPG